MMPIRSAVRVTAAVTDVELIELVRQGDDDAYGELFVRHAPAARRFAGSLLRCSSDVEDVVADAFAAVLAAIRRGRGPVDSFRTYLFTCLRHESVRASRRAGGREVLVDAGAEMDAHHADPDHSAQVVDGDTVAAAFASLTDRYRDVLWKVEVEGRSNAEIAGIHRTSTAVVATLASRARAALSRAYLELHVEPVAVASRGCADVRPLLADAVREALPPRRQRRVDEHVAGCGACREALTGLEDLNRSLRPARADRVALLPGAGIGLFARLQAWWSALGVPLASAATLTLAVIAGPVGRPPDVAAATRVEVHLSPAVVPAAEPVVEPPAAPPPPAATPTPTLPRDAAITPADVVTVPPRADDDARARPRARRSAPRGATPPVDAEVPSGRDDGDGESPVGDETPDVVVPPPADELADDVTDTADDLADTVDDTVNDTADTVNDTVNDLGDRVRDTVDDVADTVDDLPDTVDDLPDTVNDLTDTVDDTAGDVTDSVSDTAGDLTDTADDTAGDLTTPVGDAADDLADAADDLADAATRLLDPVLGG